MQNKRITISILFVFISTVCLAQGESLPPPGPSPPPGVPIDSGVLIAVFIGLFYGVKKILKNN